MEFNMSRKIGNIIEEFKHFQKWTHPIKDQKMRRDRVLACPMVVEEGKIIRGKVAAETQKKTTDKRAPKKKVVKKIMNIEFNTIVKFKSVEDNYRKEANGVKRNTVRIVSTEEDSYLQFVLLNIKFIKISCINLNKMEYEYIIRPLTDITRFESHGLIIYIFSW